MAEPLLTAASRMTFADTSGNLELPRPLGPSSLRSTREQYAVAPGSAAGSGFAVLERADRRLESFSRQLAHDQQRIDRNHVNKRGSAVDDQIRIGEAAELLGVSVDTVRRWTATGSLRAARTSGGQRTVRRSDVARLTAERRRGTAGRPIVAQSARNRFPGIVVRVVRDRAAAVVEVQAGPHRLMSLLTREAADELGLAPGKQVVCVVKSTDVMVELQAI